MGAPNFWSTFGKALSLSAQSRGIIAYCPWFLGGTIVAGVVAGFFTITYGSSFSRSDTVAALAAMMATAGFLGAVSVGCMNQIFSTLEDADFSEYLQEIDAFDQFLAWPQITYMVQMGYFVLCALSIFVVCSFDANEVNVVSLSIATIMTFYVANKTWHLIDLLRVLAWHRQDFARQLKDAKLAAGLG